MANEKNATMNRDEAINVVRNIYQTDKEKEALSILIPELAESEDERIRKELITYHKKMAEANEETCNPNNLHTKWVAYLEKQKEQKPAEWSEEDRKMLNTIISDGSRGVEFDAKQVNFLKSLRPQPHWKPSEEQLDALESAVKLYKDTHFEIHHKKIVSLYEELKKL